MKRKAEARGSSKRKAAKGKLYVNKHASIALATNDIVTIIHESDTQEYPSFDEDDILSKLVHPVAHDTFMKQYFRQKALVVHASPERYDQLISTGMCDLDVEQLLNVTSSEEFQAWVQTKDKKIESIKVHSVKEALTLHRAGHSLYMRSSDELASLLITALAKDLGMGFTTTSVFGELNGEIEIFCGKAGHTTDWHFDFMENFTVQLQGRKTWKLKKSRVPHPLRGCTPHYKTQDVVEQQLKLHRLTDPSFTYGPEITSDDDYISVTLHPGSMLYFPGGMWHRVECADDEDSISMNLSMFSTPYADVITDALRHFLLQSDQWRSGVYYNTVEEAHSHVQTLLDDLKNRIGSLTPADILPERLLVHGRDGQLRQEDTLAQSDDESDHDNNEQQDGNEDDGDVDPNSDEDNCEEHDHDDHDHDDQDDHDSDEESSNVVYLSDPNLLAESKITITSTTRFRRNPLANVMPFTDLPSIHQSHVRTDVENLDQLFILNLAYGHSSYTSSMRVEFVVCDEQKPLLDKIQTLTKPFTLKELGKASEMAKDLVHFLCHAGFLTQLH